MPGRQCAVGPWALGPGHHVTLGPLSETSDTVGNQTIDTGRSFPGKRRMIYRPALGCPDLLLGGGKGGWVGASLLIHAPPPPGPHFGISAAFANLDSSCQKNCCFLTSTAQARFFAQARHSASTPLLPRVEKSKEPGPMGPDFSPHS